MQVGGHYNYNVLYQPQAPAIHEAMLSVEEAQMYYLGGKHSDVLGKETPFSCFAAC